MSHIKNITAVTEGTKLGHECNTVFVEYDRPIVSSLLTSEMFKVENRQITRVYANTVAEQSESGQNGRYVILELSPADEVAALYEIQGRGPESQVVLREPTVNFWQVAAITALPKSSGNDGEADCGMLPPELAYRENNLIENLIVDEFRRGVFEGLRYNLYVPENYNRKKKYPLVLFIHDAGCCGEEPMITLVQGLGATIWATRAEQRKHECLILAPQFTPPPIVNDSFEADARMDTLKRLLDRIIREYNIDQRRIYTTGQSMGCMSSCELNVRYPDLFAASLLVAGQWNPETMAGIPDANLWILVSEGDKKAFPGMTAVTKAMAETGALVVHEVWDARSSQKEFRQSAQRMIETGANVLFTTFDLETIAAGSQSGPGEHHVTTWQVVYAIEAVRDWLFSKCRDEERSSE